MLVAVGASIEDINHSCFFFHYRLEKAKNVEISQNRETEKNLQNTFTQGKQKYATEFRILQQETFDSECLL